MSKRRTDAEIAEVRAIGEATSAAAAAIEARVNGEEDSSSLFISASSWWDVKAPYQKD